MYIERFMPNIHMKYLKQWMNSRDIGQQLEHGVPEHGYVAYIDDLPVAAAFIRRCEGNLGILDGYVTNPKMPAKVRDSALDFLTNKLIRDSKQLNLKGILALTTDNSIIKRSLKHNFVPLEHKVMILSLNHSK